MVNTTASKNIPLPDGFQSETEAVEWVREQREEDIDFDRLNRQRGQEDSEFAAGYQWNQEDLDRRRKQGAPSLTFNRSFSLLRNKLAARTRVRVGPRILPESAGKEYDAIAAIREGIVRNVERISDVGTCDSIVSQNQFVAGVGAYEIAVDYADNDVFENDIFLRPVYDPFSVTWDRLSTDPTGRDARHAMIETYLDIDDFKRAYPKASTESIDTTVDSGWEWTGQRRKPSQRGWITDKTVRVATVWRMRERMRNLAMLTNGDVVEIGDEDPATYAKEDGQGGFVTVMTKPDSGEFVVRKSPVKYAEGFITNGVEVLEGPFELPIDRVPLIRVPGWCVPLGNKVERFGLFSFAKDAMRFYNYVRSDRIERIIFRPRFSFTANAEEVQGYEQLWTNAHLARNAIGIHKGPSGGGPMQVQPPTVDAASIAESESAVNDILDVFDVRQQVEMGKTPPTASGLEMLQSVSDASNVVFDEMYFAGKRECYRTINQLIPFVYDTPRIIKVLGEDDQLKTAIVNDPMNPESVDVTVGKYSVSVDVGPSLLTRRAHSVEFLKTIINSAPDAAGIVFDKLIELQNIQGGDVLARRWRERFGITDEEAEPTPEEQQQAALEQQIQMVQLENQLKMAQAEVDLKMAEVEAKRAEVEVKTATADSERAQAEERRTASQANFTQAQARIEEIAAKIRLTEAQITKTLTQPTPSAN